MKKLLTLILTLSLMLTLTACGGDTAPETNNNRTDTPTTATPPINELPNDESTPPPTTETQQADEKVEIELFQIGITNEQLAEMVASGEIPANVTRLNLNGNEISDITPLSSLTKLTFLNLNGNQISDITPLSNLTNLVGLHLNNNPIIDITPLNNLIDLKNLGLQGVSLTKQEADNLQAMLSNCDISLPNDFVADADTISETFTITYNANGGRIRYVLSGDDDTEEISFTVEHGFNWQTSPEAYDVRSYSLSNRYYSFGGWYTDAELSNLYEFIGEVTSDLTLYAKWVE